MTNLNFPSSPTTGQVYTFNNKSWTWNGTSWVGTINSTTSSSIVQVSDQFTGDGSTTVYTLSVPSTTNNSIVSVSGVGQIPTGAYSISGSTLTMSAAVPSGIPIEVRTPTVYSTYGNATAFNNYYYVATAGQTIISGGDANANTLSYTPGVVTVYVNGLKLVSGVDFTATDGGTITLSTALVLNDVVEVLSYSSAIITPPATTIAAVPSVTIGSVAYESVSSVSTTSTAQVTLDTLDANAYRTAKYLVQCTDTTNNLYHSTEIMLIHTGAGGVVYMTEYATVYTSVSLLTLDAIIAGGQLFLLGTPTNPNNTIKLHRVAVYS